MKKLTQADIAGRVLLHNALQLVLGVACIPASIFLWWFSFKFFQAAFTKFFEIFLDSGSTIGFYLAWLCMIPLAIEGVRNTRPLFDLSEYARSGFYDNFIMQSSSGRALSWMHGHPGARAFWITQILFSAPRTMVLAFKSLRSFLPVSSDIAADAARILSELRSSRQWTPAAEYKQHGAALKVLRDLHLIWTEEKSGQLEIRYPAGTA